MTDIFISYERSTETQARRVAETLQAMGYGVWTDDEIPAHRSFREVIEEQLAAARVVLVLWSAETANAEWVLSEASRARAMGSWCSSPWTRRRCPCRSISFNAPSWWGGRAIPTRRGGGRWLPALAS